METIAQSIDGAAARFGWDELRPGLREAIEALLDGTDVLAVLPTGYGKSAVYKIAGALIPGPTIVVSPLIALWRSDFLATSSSAALQLRCSACRRHQR